MISEASQGLLLLVFIITPSNKFTAEVRHSGKNISNNRTQEPEARGSQDLGQFELHGMILSLKTKQKKNRSRFTREMAYNLRAK